MISKVAGIVETITGFFEQLVESGYLTLDYIFYISLALELVLIVFFLIKSSFSYELRLDRSLDGLNRWLYYNQYLDETNLIDFNNRIKRAPKLLRYHWQQYMLYREKDPSHYMSANNCIEKPLKTSSFLSNIKNLSVVCYTLAAAAFTLNFAHLTAISQNNLGYILLNSLLTPFAIILFSTFFIILLRSWQNSNLAGLYQNFHLFSRYVDKACTTLPEYIDFEVLFTKDEIKRGIPVLNEFLEKRARQEQKELEEAMRNSVEHEDYDFSHLGLSGAQILERAMKETEIYLNQRQRTLAEIQQLESEIESAKRNYENNQKEYQRKMQASKENVERLRKQQEESTNRIESNYIRKQQTDEIKKQEQLEKDYEGVTLRYNQDINTLTAEITARRKELEEKKEIVEKAMQAEYQTFSNKVYKDLKLEAHEKEKETKEKLSQEKDNYAALLQQANLQIVEQESQLKHLRSIIEASQINLADHGEFYSEDLRKVAKQRNKKTKNQPDTDTDQAAPIMLEKTPHKPQAAESLPTSSTEQPQYDEFGGYYDSEGYYRYKNGTYYDPQGNFHDEFGGYYDKDGNYFPPQQTQTMQEPAQEAATTPEPEYDQFGGYYDSEGYYRYKNGTYYDPQGNFHDEFGGYYDPQGNYFPPQQTSNLSALQPQEIAGEKVQEETQPQLTESTLKEKQTEIAKQDATDNQVKEQTEAENKVAAEQLKDSQVESEVKDEVKDEVKQTTEAEQPPKRKRGRPRKVDTQQAAVQQQSQVEPQAQEKAKPEAKQQTVQTEDAPAPKKRGRGRPRKVDTQQVETTTSSTVETDEPKQQQAPKRGRGRPRKVESEQQQATTTSAATTPTASGAATPTASETTTPKRGRGRPRKVDTTATSATTTKQKASASKKHDATNVEDELKPRSKRGRPLKKRTTKSEERESISMLEQLSQISSQIEQENQALQEHHEALKKQIDSTLNQIDSTLNETDENNSAN